jgi:hypothetical protein
VPQFLRAIRQQRWFTSPAIAWLPPGELQADALLDLKTDGNELSIFEVDDLSNAERIAVAIAAKRERLDVLDYVIFDGEPFSALGVHIKKIAGTTPDVTVNGVHYHVYELTARRLIEVAHIVAQRQRVRILRKRVKDLLKDGVAAGRLDPKVNTQLLTNL